jgi:hypothetical protein
MGKSGADGGQIVRTVISYYFRFDVAFVIDREVCLFGI